MSHRVATGLVSAPVPGAWHRLKTLLRDVDVNPQTDGSPSQFLPVYANLEHVGIPRHHLGLVWMVQSWHAQRVPPEVAFSLWLLRDSMTSEGALPHYVGMRAEDYGPTIRYIQLAWSLGERLDTDDKLRRATNWLVNNQHPDGSIPPSIGFPVGETGNTARALRALSRVAAEPLADDQRNTDASFASDIIAIKKATNRMHTYLTHTLRVEGDIAGWSYTANDGDLPMITGATSLAAGVLLEVSTDWQSLTPAIAFLIRAQDDRSGGWAEVAGSTLPTLHNTFNACRALRLAIERGVHVDEATAARCAASKWFCDLRHGYNRRQVSEAAFAVRLAAELDLLKSPRATRLVRGLVSTQTLSTEADLYAATELSALALHECSVRVQSKPAELASYSWIYALPTMAPPFLRRTSHFYELMYSPFSSRRWFAFMDGCLGRGIIDRTVGLLLGAVVSLGFVNDSVLLFFEQPSSISKSYVAAAMLAFTWLIWLGVKASAQSSIWAAARASTGSLVVATLLTWLLFTPAPLVPNVLTLLGLRWLVTDIVAYTADSSGLLDRLLTK